MMGLSISTWPGYRYPHTKGGAVERNGSDASLALIIKKRKTFL